MVKGVSRQVILVKPPEPKLFEQAIFILRADVPREGITDEMLLKEAGKAVQNPPHRKWQWAGPVWACIGAMGTGLLWLVCALL